MTKIKSTLTTMVMATPLAVSASQVPTYAAHALPPARAAVPVAVGAPVLQDWQWGAPVSVANGAADTAKTVAWYGDARQSVTSQPGNAGYEIEGLLKQPQLQSQFATLIQRDGKWIFTHSA